MVVFNNAIDRLSKATNLLPNTQKLRQRVYSSSPHLGILSFETAKTMSRLISLYRSLSDNEMSKLKDCMNTEGVSFLNSKDPSFLLSLACSERLEDLENAASTVARLGLKCVDFGLNRFDIVFNELKLGIIDLGKLDYGSKQIEKKVMKMERLVMATSNLYSSLEGLAEMEISEKRMKFWKQKNGEQNRTNIDLFNQKIALQRKDVRRFRSSSLWRQSFDRSVGLMARTICIIYARICFVFGPYNSSLPRVTLKNIRSPEQRENLRNQQEYCLLEPRRVNITKSGPIPMSAKPNLVRFHSQKSIFSSPENNRVFHVADPSTVGGSGLAIRYANVIVTAERYLEMDCSIGKDERQSLYEMLPENLKLVIRKKLSKIVKTSGGLAAENGGDENMAKGWRDAVNEILKWLEPVATDTLKWQSERSFEKMKFEFKPSVLLLQTLHFSDKVKTEAAIAEVLVGLSCVCWYEDRRCDGEDQDSVAEISRISLDR
ncbi:uncharacterized protein LOC124910338 [Impatiens glandulifera]|uniref:uncharacterized protein LOC124910338 n=1 Tax=Impatiens glandulifera TaxID=253017 RepID=UPI001FB0F9F8|nr:uncharacterized protein LOC124910338 [Impatiens glandulifera]